MGRCDLKWGTSKKLMVFVRENPIKMDDDWGYPHSWKPPCGLGLVVQDVMIHFLGICHEIDHPDIGCYPFGWVGIFKKIPGNFKHPAIWGSRRAMRTHSA